MARKLGLKLFADHREDAELMIAEVAMRIRIDGEPLLQVFEIQ